MVLLQYHDTCLMQLSCDIMILILVLMQDHAAPSWRWSCAHAVVALLIARAHTCTAPVIKGISLHSQIEEATCGKFLQVGFGRYKAIIQNLVLLVQGYSVWI